MMRCSPMNERYVKVAGDHPLELYRDPAPEPRYIMLLCDQEPPTVGSTENIRVVKAPRSIDNRWALHIRLSDDVNDDRLKQIFNLFVEDLINTTKKTEADDAANLVLSRYKQWIALFKPHRNPLTKNEVQGLIGELLVLSKVLIPAYGEMRAIESWMNAKKGKQDFVFDDKWYEVKTIQESRLLVTITSIEQLDRDDEGIFVIVKLRETSLMSSKCITLNSLFLSISDLIESTFEKDKLRAMVLASGYSPNPEYDNFAFELVDITQYSVTANFPRIRRNDLKFSEINNLTYELLVDRLGEFRL